MQKKLRLMEAFMEGPFMAYGRLRKAKWTGEQVDVFANKIRRSAKFAGYMDVMHYRQGMYLSWEMALRSTRKCSTRDMLAISLGWHSSQVAIRL